jgi:DNA-binding MarR family transcriptional regulator
LNKSCNALSGVLYLNEIAGAVMNDAPVTMPGTEEGALPLRVWLALFANVRQIENLIRTNLRETFGSTLPRFDLLSQLYRAPDGLTMGELSARLMVSNGNVTGLITRLVAEKLVSRIQDEQDKRVQRVTLSAKGRRVFENMIPANQSWVTAAMAGMSRDDLAEMHQLLLRLKGSVASAVRAHHGTAPAGGDGDGDGEPPAPPRPRRRKAAAGPE